MIFLITRDLRILSATVDDDAALDGGSVVAIYVHFARAASEASARIVDCLLLCIGRCKRWLDAGSLKRDPCAFEFLRWSNFDDLHALSVANDAHNGSRSGSSSAISLNLASISVARFRCAFARSRLPICAS